MEDNERLEFLGDAVLELAVSDSLFRRFPQSREGELTRMRAKLVSEPSLAAAARAIGLNEMIMLGKGEESQGGRTRDSILSDAMEAVFGAVFLDGGYESSRETIAEVLLKKIPKVDTDHRVKDAKSRLQEMTQKRFKERPVYKPAGTSGPEHAKIFQVELELPDGRKVYAEGTGMKKAEQKAAAKALELLADDMQVEE